MQYTVRGAAAATGVTASRLRTWERRFGVPKPDRSRTGRRLYNEVDLQVIRRMVILVGAGVPAAQAAAAALEDAQPVVAEGAPAAGPASPRVAEFLAAAERYDEVGVTSVLERAVAESDWEQAAEQVLFPALRELGLRWETGVTISATEHFASALVRRLVESALAAQAHPPAEAARVLVACPESERHEIGILVLALLLRRHGINVVYLGPDVPSGDLIASATALKPAAVCLAATTAGGRASLGRTARVFIRERAPGRLLVGGPGIDVQDGTIPGTRLPQRVGDAAEVVARILGIVP